MKVVFKVEGSKKEQVFKIKNEEDLRTVLLIAKAEDIRTRRLPDLDFSEARLTCKIDGKKASMKKLIQWAEENITRNSKRDKKKVNSSTKTKKKDSKTKKKKSSSKNKNKKKDKAVDKKKKKDKHDAVKPIIVHNAPKEGILLHRR